MKYLYVALLLSFVACSQEKNGTSAESTDSTSLNISSWQVVKAKNEPLPRHENAFASVGGKFYLIGGRGSKPVDIYDPQTNSWTQGQAPPLEMHHFQAVPFQGSIYVMGALTGGYPDEQPIPNIYIYDPAADTWTKGAEIPKARRRGAAGVVVRNNKFYLVDGIQRGHLGDYTNWLDTYDPVTGEWKILADAPHKRDHFNAAVVGDKLYAAGGRTSSAATDQTLELTVPQVDIYDFAADRWTTAEQPIPTERAGTTAIASGQHLIIIGGESVAHEAAHNEVEVFDTDTQQWDSLPDLNTGRHGTQGFLYNGKIYIAAGSANRGGGPELNDMEVFEPN